MNISGNVDVAGTARRKILGSRPCTILTSLMKRKCLRNKFLKGQNKENKTRWSSYQRNYYVSLIKKMEKDYRNNLNIKK